MCIFAGIKVIQIAGLILIHFLMRKGIRIVRAGGVENDTETIYTMLSRGTEFIDSIDALTERKMVAMRSRAVKPSQIITVEDRMNELRNVQKERRERSGTGAKINKMDAIT